MAKTTNKASTHITLYVKDQADQQTFAEAQRLFPFFLNKSVSQFCIEAVREKVLKLQRTKGESAQ